MIFVANISQQCRAESRGKKFSLGMCLAVTCATKLCHSSQQALISVFFFCKLCHLEFNWSPCKACAWGDMLQMLQTIIAHFSFLNLFYKWVSVDDDEVEICDTAVDF